MWIYYNPLLHMYKKTHHKWRLQSTFAPSTTTITIIVLLLHHHNTLQRKKYLLLLLFHRYLFSFDPFLILFTVVRDFGLSGFTLVVL